MSSDRERAVCAWLRESPEATTTADDAVVDCAREHRLHLVLATRVRRADLAAELRGAASVDAAGVEHQLDVHWRISNVLAFGAVLTYAEVAADAVWLRPLGAHALTPSTPHSLALACIHRVAHHRESGNLLWLYDIALLA